MSKSKKYQKSIDFINEIAATARNKGISHLYTEDESLNGKKITINNKELLNFGSCSYLGLETDTSIKKEAINAINQYGSQFSSSRTYVSFTLYKELETLLEKIFNHPVILSSSTSLGHHAVIPIVVEDEDAVIMDHQAHVSMQDTISKLQVRGITVTLLRHSRLDELKTKIMDLGAKHDKVWYFFDGVYSMYGDLSPVKEILKLLETYPKLHIYLDDAHGMSWTGKNGSGYFLSQTDLHSRMILSTSLAKGFASAGGVFIIPDHELYWRVKNWGGPLTYSGPQQPAVIGASIASAKIHLSNRIFTMQESISKLIQHCNEILKYYQLPVISSSISPIFFIGLGLPKVGYNMVRKLMDDGLYINLGIFPAVPENCTGIRFTINLHHSFDDINRLVERVAFHLPKVLREEGRTLHDVHKAFRNSKLLEQTEYKFTNNNILSKNKLNLKHATTIKDVSKKLWNDYMGRNGAFDWHNLELFEESFKGNKKKEENWEFHYYMITDENKNLVLATFFTQLLTKRDMLSKPEVSKKIEKKRQEDFYCLTAPTLMMGTIMTEGQHLFLDRSHRRWKEALMLLLDTMLLEQPKSESDIILLRDFGEGDIELKSLMQDQGFIEINQPVSHIIESSGCDSFEDYISHLNSKKRYHIRKDALEKAEWFELENVTETSGLDYLYSLYENVASKSYEINTFKLPRKLFGNLINSPNWDVIALRLKSAYDPRPDQLPVAVEFSYKTKNSYYPILIGLDYQFLDEARVYKQLLYRIVERAIQLKCKRIHFGLTASLEKRKLGAVTKSNVAFVRMEDTFDSSLLNLIPNV